MFLSLDEFFWKYLYKYSKLYQCEIRTRSSPSCSLLLLSLLVWTGLVNLWNKHLFGNNCNDSTSTSHTSVWVDEQVFGEPTSTCRHVREPPLSTDTAAVRSAWNSLSLSVSLFYVNRPEWTCFSKFLQYLTMYRIFRVLCRPNKLQCGRNW